MDRWIAYAIRQKSTGYYMPTRWGKSRGYSWDEPTPDCFPRLFKSKRAAKCAIAAWLSGHWEKVLERITPFGEGPWGNDYEELAPVAETVPGRAELREDLEVVEILVAERAIPHETAYGGTR